MSTTQLRVLSDLKPEECAAILEFIYLSKIDRKFSVIFWVASSSESINTGVQIYNYHLDTRLPESTASMSDHEEQWWLFEPVEIDDSEDEVIL